MRAAVDRMADSTHRSLTAAWVRAWDQLAFEFTLALEELLAIRADRWPTRAQIQRANRAQWALETTQRALERLAAQARTEITAAAHAGIHVGIDGQQGIVASQLPPGYQGLRFNRVPEDQLAAIVDRTAQQITAVTWPISAAATDAIRNELVRGMAMGLNPREVARQMLARVEGAFNGGLARALNIARTELLDAHRSAAALSQAANAGLLEGWTWHSELSRRTCASCWSKHGSEHPLSEQGPDDHPSGRCSRTPITRSWRDLGFDIPEPPSILPDAETTFNALPRSDQLHIMGPGRLAAIDRGDVAWSDLSALRTNPGWRDSWGNAPLRDLLPA
jgi:hypothetical protein